MWGKGESYWSEGEESASGTEEHGEREIGGREADKRIGRGKSEGTGRETEWSLRGSVGLLKKV